MHARLNKQERAEYKRLEVIASDATLSETERELSRERIQRLRDAAVARAKLREIQGRDVTQSAARKSSEEFEDLNPAPLRSNFSSDEEYREEHKWHQLLLDEVAAEGVLADPNASFSKRETAKRLLRKTYKAQHEMCPNISALDGSFLPDTGEDVLATPAPASDAPAPAVVADSPWITGQRPPFKHKPGTDGYASEVRQCEAIERMFYLGKLKRDNPEEFEKEIERYQKPKDDSCFSSPGSTNAPKPFIASSAQKQVWQEQSEKFARQRGESIAETTTAPIVTPRSYRTAYKILLDGLIVWPWGELAPSRSLSDVQVFPITAPPGYVSGSGAVPPGWHIDEIDMLWRQK